MYNQEFTLYAWHIVYDHNAEQCSHCGDDLDEHGNCLNCDEDHED